MMLVSTQYIFSVPHQKKAMNWRHKVYAKGSIKLNQTECSDTGEVETVRHLKGRRCECFDFYEDLIPYKDAWSWQKFIVQKRKILVERGEDHSDTLIILQHQPVYTMGTRSSEKFLKFDMKNAPYDLFQTERGGEVTYHGPGQLVMYPIVNLFHHKMDIHWYLRSLEEVIINALFTTFSIRASRIAGLTGVWVGSKKLAAVGIRVSRWITFHGLALNVTTDLTPFQHIVPCGIHGREVGTLSELLWGSAVRTGADETKDLMNAIHDSLLREFSQVFRLSIELKTISDLQKLLVK